MIKKVIFFSVLSLCMANPEIYAKSLDFQEVKTRLSQTSQEANYEIGKLWQDIGIKPKLNKKDADFFGCAKNINDCAANDLTFDTQRIGKILNVIEIHQTLDSQILLFDYKTGVFVDHFEYRMQKQGGPSVEYLGDNVFLIEHMGMSGTGVLTKEARVMLLKAGKIKEVSYFITEHYRMGWGLVFDSDIKSDHSYKNGTLSVEYEVVVTPTEDKPSDGSKVPEGHALRAKRRIIAHLNGDRFSLDKKLSTTTPDAVEDLALGGDAEYSRFYGKIFDNWIKGYLNESCGVFRYFHEYSDADGKGIEIKDPDGEGTTRVKRVDEIRTLRGLGTLKINPDIPDIAIPPTAFPLKVGFGWADPDVGIKPGDRPDKMYFNYVEKIEDVTVPAGTFKKCFKIVYRGIPEDTAEWYCPGVGVVKIEYHHHGTIDNMLIELKELCN